MSTTPTIEAFRAGSGPNVLIAEIREDDQPVDLRLASEKLFILRRPDGNEVQKTALFTTDGSDGKVQCTLTEADLNYRDAGVCGHWSYVVKLAGLAGWAGETTTTGQFQVLPRFQKYP